MKFSKESSHTLFQATLQAAQKRLEAGLPGGGAHLLKVVPQVCVQLVDVPAGGDLERGLFNIVLQLADNLMAVVELDH